jgi:hypothetical protein
MNHYQSYVLLISEFNKYFLIFILVAMFVLKIILNNSGRNRVIGFINLRQACTRFTHAPGHQRQCARRKQLGQRVAFE